jgi:hypothetical protein
MLEKEGKSTYGKKFDCLRLAKLRPWEKTPSFEGS